MASNAFALLFFQNYLHWSGNAQGHLTPAGRADCYRLPVIYKSKNYSLSTLYAWCNYLRLWITVLWIPSNPGGTNLIYSLDLQAATCATSCESLATNTTVLTSFLRAVKDKKKGNPHDHTRWETFYRQCLGCVKVKPSRAILKAECYNLFIKIILAI